MLIVVDTLRRDHLAPYGYHRDPAPRLGQLAARGAVIDGLAPSSWTKPSTATLLTGLHPLRHQAIENDDALPGEADTLAERLKARGYVTVGASGNISVSPGFGFDQGFDRFVLSRGAAFGTGPSAAELNQELRPHLDALRHPFFLYVHYMDPHSPYEPPSAWDGSPLPGRAAARRPVANEALRSTERLHRPPELLADVLDLYDGEIRAVDAGIGALLDELTARRLLDSAVVVVTSDHGEEMQEHGRMEHGQTLYEEVLRVPMVLVSPGRIVPGRRAGTMALEDVVPTLAELLGLALPAGAVDGVSVAGPLGAEGQVIPPRDRLFHLEQRGAVALAFTSEDDKLILGRGPYTKALFDTRADPGEGRPLEIDATSRPRFQHLAGTLAGTYNGLVARALPRQRAEASAEVREALRGLGYAAAGGVTPRGIPPTIGPAPADGVGLLGWNERFRPCVRPGEAETDAQLLDGWWPVENGGRWTRPDARLALASPAGAAPRTLELAGENLDPRPANVRLLLDGRELAARELPSGAFTLKVPLTRALSDPAILDIERRPAFVPAEGGQPDHRELGLFLHRVCLHP